MQLFVAVLVYWEQSMNEKAKAIFLRRNKQKPKQLLLSDWWPPTNLTMLSSNISLDETKHEQTVNFRVECKKKQMMMIMMMHALTQ